MWSYRLFVVRFQFLNDTPWTIPLAQAELQHGSWVENSQPPALIHNNEMVSWASHNPDTLTVGTGGWVGYEFYRDIGGNVHIAWNFPWAAPDNNATVDVRTPDTLHASIEGPFTAKGAGEDHEGYAASATVTVAFKK